MNTSIFIRNDGTIHLSDVNDYANGTSAFNRGKRSLKKAHAFIAENRARLEALTIGKVCDELDQFGMKMHLYCSVD